MMHTSANRALALYLKRLMLRSPLAADEQAAMLRVKNYRARKQRGEEVVSPGAEMFHTCLVADGLLGRFDQMRNGDRQFTALYITGDLCDLHSVISPVTAWGLEALTTTSILQIPHTDLKRIAQDHPALAFAFWRDTAVDASILAKWVSNLGRKDALARLAHLYCEIGLRMELAGLGTRTDFSFPIRQAQLADAVGMTPVYLNRMLKSLRRDHIAQVHRTSVRVMDWDRLVELADFDDQFLLLAPDRTPYG